MGAFGEMLIRNMGGDLDTYRGDKPIKTEVKMKEIKKTGYQWCLDSSLRILDLNNYDADIDSLSTSGFSEADYFEAELTEERFLNAIRNCRVKERSTPRKTEKYLEYRMYGLVPYNLSGIQKGIQFGHAKDEYSDMVRYLSGVNVKYNKWISQDKTYIILNGGTTNENKESKFYGSLQQHRDLLVENGIQVSEFKEPDLNDTLTGVVFLVDERVFDRKLYPNFEPTPIPKYFMEGGRIGDVEKINKQNEVHYSKWVEKIGGEKNAFLREFLITLRLA
tara:strand:+ start:145659 stop:146489 length:831 start_codon:yes stop_codon:yes gene_type:complete